MGSDISCPCGRDQIETEETPNQEDLMEKVLIGKLTQQEIILEFQDEQTKVCLIKTVNVENFFNNRNLLRLNNRKDCNKYYNSIYITNYLGKSEYSMVVLQDSPYYYKIQKNNETTGKYSVEYINLVSSNSEHVVEQFIHCINSNLKKNYSFVGIINDFQNNNRQFYILSKLGYIKEEITNYSISIYQSENKDICEKNILEVLNSNENYYKKLKAIMIDYIPSTQTQVMITTSSSLKNKKVKKDKEYSKLLIKINSIILFLKKIINSNQNNNT